jgi:hypothetical protein
MDDLIYDIAVDIAVAVAWVILLFLPIGMYLNGDMAGVSPGLFGMLYLIYAVGLSTLLALYLACGDGK